MRRVPVFLLLLLLVVPAAADEKQPAEKPKPLTVEQAADAVLAAAKAKDAAALKALAEKDEPDPWLVADELCYRGKHDAAAALAKAASRVDTEKLPAYLEGWRTREPDKADRELFAATNTAMRARTPQKVIEATEALDPKMDTVTRVRLRHVRGIALGLVRRHIESAGVLREAADAALALGWLVRALPLYGAAGSSAYHGSALPAAVASWEKGLAIAERRGDKHIAAQMLGNIGVAHSQLGEYQEALSAHERVLEAMRALGERKGSAQALSNIGTVHLELGDYPRALSSFERALEAMRALGEKAGAAHLLGNIGSVHLRVDDYAQALSCFERALEVMSALGDRQGAATAFGNIGHVHLKLGDFPKALEFFERALAEKKAVGDRYGAAKTLGNLGNVHALRGDYPKALSAYERALTEKRAIGDRPGAASTLGNIGSVHLDHGDYAKALSTYERVLAEQTALGNRRSVAAVLGNIGIVHTRLGEYQKALSTFERALAVKNALGNRAGAANTLGNIGEVHHKLGDYAKALQLHERALAERKSLGDTYGAALTLGNIGTVHVDLGDCVKALSTYERALAEQRAMGDKPGAARTLGNIGVVHLIHGDYAKALSTFERALAEKEAVGDRQGAAQTLSNIGNVHTRLGEYQKALSTLERALAEKKALGDRAGAANTLGNIGEVHRRLGDYTRARSLLEKGARAAKRLRATPLLVFVYTRLAHLHLTAGNPARALDAAQKALDATELLLGGLGQEQGATARETHALLFEIGALASVREEDAAEALTFLESGRAGALLDALDKREALRWKAESLSPELRRLDLDARAKERAARHAYDLVIKHEGSLKELRAAGEALDHATEAVREVAGKIQRELSSELKQQIGFFYPRANTIEEIEEVLEGDQALALYGLCQDEALALVLRRDGERIVSLGKVAEIVAACEALDATDPDVDPEPALGALRKLIIEPLRLGEDIKQVLVSPEGPLCYLPFGALFDQTVAMTPSGTTHVLLLGEERQPGKGILALGEPDYAGASKAAQAIYYRGRTLSPLSATRKEVETVGTKQLLGANASEAGLRDTLSESKRWRAVHFACHGLVDIDRPMLSSLALSRADEDDGFLTALEILRTKIPADLAVLSACETATGKIVKGEGIVGLTRAFMFAGAPRVICSLWKVDDEATQALMIKFYELWNPKEGDGIGAAAALKQAQSYIRGHDKWKHPYYWAAWVLWGLPD